MATKPVAKAAVAKKTTGNGADTKQHRLPGVKTKTETAAEKAAAAKTATNNLLSKLSKKSTTQPKKKSEKPVIVLEGKAAQLLDLQEARAQMKTLEGKVAQLEEELLPECEMHRLAICAARQEYIGSIHVQASASEDDEEDIEAGQAVYYVQHKYSAFDPFAPSTDDDVKEAFGDEATLKHEAIAAIVATFQQEGQEISSDDAEKMLDARMEVKPNISLMEGALQDPKVVAILQEHLADYLVSKTAMTPTETFSQRASYDDTDKAIMRALNSINLSRRAKAVLKPSGAPQQG